MFLLNLGSRWGLVELENLGGVVCLPASISCAKLERGLPDVGTVLIDPQMYLAGLDASKCSKVCGRLAGYSWFCVPNVVPFSESGQGQREWEKAVRETIETEWPGEAPSSEEEIAAAAKDAIEFQWGCGATSVLIPCPLLEEREDEAESLGAWLDAGIEAAEEMECDLPLIASVAVHAQTLNDAAFEDGGLLDAIVDQVASREFDSVYVVFAEDTSNRHSFDMVSASAKGYLQLVEQFHLAGVPRVVTNFADLVGYACLGLGATAFASGSSANRRFLNLDMLKDDGFGTALPHFYSHRSATEYRSERDLQKIVDARLVRRIEDETEASAPLVDAMRRGQTGQHVPAWAESKSNITASAQHYVEVLVREGHAMRKVKPSGRRQRIIDWINDVDAVLTQVDKRVGAALGRKPDPVAWLNALMP